ncbi:hypothetical protein CCP3SC15_1110005 [Gammaproteobacteria bacterium]
MNKEKLKCRATVYHNIFCHTAVISWPDGRAHACPAETEELARTVARNIAAMENVELRWQN